MKLESLELPKGASPELLREKLEDSEALRILSEKRLAFQKEFTEELRAFCHGEDSWKQKREQVSKKFNEIRRPCSADICKQVLLEIKKRTE